MTVSKSQGTSTEYYAVNLNYFSLSLKIKGFLKNEILENN